MRKYLLLLLLGGGLRAGAQTTSLGIYGQLGDSQLDLGMLQQYLPDSIYRPLAVRPTEASGRVDLVNFYALQGWTLVTSYPEIYTYRTGEPQSRTYHLMKRTITVDTATAATIRERLAANSKRSR